jgi:hypothetical protein
MFSEIASLIASLVLGGALTYFLTQSKIKRELESEYDSDLRKRRMESYKKIWELFVILPQYGTEEKDATYAIVWQLSINLKEWYFKEGVIFLSEDCRKAFGELQEFLGAKVVEQYGSTQKVGPVLYEEIRKKCSKFRKQLLKDIGTRSAPLLKQ